MKVAENTSIYEICKMYQSFSTYIGKNKFETFGMITVDKNMNIIKIHTDIFKGTITSCNVSTVGILYYALKDRASNIILFHNHPSGDLSASDDDIKTMKKISKACDLTNLKMLGHIIITKYTCCYHQNFKS
jgi:DNA repair protein RadC